MKLKKLLCAILVAATMLSFFPGGFVSVAKADDLGSGQTVVVPEIEITPRYKNGTTGTPVTTSYVDSVILNSSGGFAQNSFTGANVYVRMLNGSGNSLPTTKYCGFLLKETGSMYSDHHKLSYLIDNADAAFGGKFPGHQAYDNFQAELPTNGDLSERLYFYSLFIYKFDDANDYGTYQLVGKTSSSISVSYFREKTSTISWERVGMQVRTINGIPIGKYVYVNNNYASLPTLNNGEYAAFSGIPYFNIQWSNSGEAQLGSSVGIANITELYQWIRDYVAGPFSAQGINLNGAILLGGPSIIMGKNDPTKGNVLFLDAYYKSTTQVVTGEPEGSADALGLHQTGSSNQNWRQNINTYASWGNNSREDFLQAAYITCTVNLQDQTDITVLCYDEDAFLADMSVAPIKTETVPFEDVVDCHDVAQLKSLTHALVLRYADALVLDEWLHNNISGVGMVDHINEYLNANFGMLVQLLSSVQYDPEHSSLVSGKISEVLETALGMQEIRRRAIEAIADDDYLSLYIGDVTVTPPDIDGYEFDFGFGLDMFTDPAMPLGAAVSTASRRQRSAVSTAAFAPCFEIILIAMDTLTHRPAPEQRRGQ